MTIRDVKPVFGLHGFGLGASDGNDQIVGAEVEVAKIALAKRAEKFAHGVGIFLERASANIGVFEPIDSLFVVFAGVDGGVWVELVEF